MGSRSHGRRDDTAQVVFTLLDNARKHAAIVAGRRPRRGARRRRRRSTSRTDGIGIPARSCERVFERGVRGDDSAGSGLGLFIARRLMAEQGGSIAVRSRPGGGTSFVLRFRARRVRTAVDRSRCSPRCSHDRRVLVVEDHALVAIGLQLALSARGWEVETTDGPTAADVIEHAHRFQPQCVLLDIGLGEGVGSGIDLIAPLRATGAEVVMLTAETRRAVLAACLEAGAAGWIGKDAFLDEVVAALDDVLAGTPLIGCAAREAMIDELRIERAGQRRALSPFERLTAARARACSPRSSTACPPRRSPRPSSSR